MPDNSGSRGSTLIAIRNLSFNTSAPVEIAPADSGGSVFSLEGSMRGDLSFCGWSLAISAGLASSWGAVGAEHTTACVASASSRGQSVTSRDFLDARDLRWRSRSFRRLSASTAASAICSASTAAMIASAVVPAAASALSVSILIATSLPRLSWFPSLDTQQTQRNSQATLRYRRL